MNPDEDELPIVDIDDEAAGCRGCLAGLIAIGIVVLCAATVVVFVVGLITSVEWALS